MGGVKVIRSSDDYVEFELEGEGHTLCNVLCEELYKDESVVFASYKIGHPLVGKPVVYVRTDSSKSAINAVVDAAKRIKERSQLFKELFKKAFKE